MKRIVILAAIAFAACTSTAPPPVVMATPEEQLLDPRLEFDPADPALERRFDVAWRSLMAGDLADASRRLAEIRTKNPNYLPAELAQALVDLRHGDAAAARIKVNEVRAARPRNLAAQIYDAEVAVGEHDLKRAYEVYRDVIAHSNAPPAALQRLRELSTRYFDLLYQDAIHSPDAGSAIALLREALQVNPAATAARIALAQKLVAARRMDEAAEAIQPIATTAEAESPAVQQVLAEVDFSRGHYEDAIARYERIVRRGGNDTAARRLEEIKLQYAEANMPAQFKRAIEDNEITRADLAVLMYWKVSSVRFAQNLPAPPIAIDVSETPGREELIRAIALGIYGVDPVTRRVGPNAPVNASGLARIAARLLALRGAECARGVPQSDSSRVLAQCGITDPTLAGADLPVSGRTAATVLEQVDRALH